MRGNDLRELRLCTDLRVIRSAFKEWSETLKANALVIGSSWQIEGTDVRFRRMTRQKQKLHSEFWIGSNYRIAVQLNEPGTAGSENPGCAIGLDTHRRRYLLRQGDLHDSDPSRRIKGDQFAARTGLSPISIRLRTGEPRKRWYLVTPLDGISKDAIRAATAEFVSRCWNARTYGAEAAKDQERLISLFGPPERGGWYDFAPDPTPKRVLKLQGYVFAELERVLGSAGIEIEKPRHAARYEVDGTIDTPTGPILIEIKTGTTAADVYCGVGQLVVYPTVLPDLNNHRKLLLLPGVPHQALVDALEGLDVELHSYDITRGRRSAKVRFSQALLRRCGMSDKQMRALH